MSHFFDPSCRYERAHCTCIMWKHERNMMYTGHSPFLPPPSGLRGGAFFSSSCDCSSRAPSSRSLKKASSLSCTGYEGANPHPSLHLTHLFCSQLDKIASLCLAREKASQRGRAKRPAGQSPSSANHRPGAAIFKLRLGIHTPPAPFSVSTWDAGRDAISPLSQIELVFFQHKREPFFK
ncbi:hypothetical protein DL89DRAFT_143196 [Linderina pennispora]|uniref:Uncharacterized protein n=1 Tax=Linderina pennispora TaxID=61395 RepID=A0A1Y1WC63_9FUNG|nr:uncharacterized protein DL89DRAFT_143196 [Linderina pennispora]ORX70918.1 hypothetical protein DL89DRAFT_143196 [Linderina pennispora]